MLLPPDDEVVSLAKKVLAVEPKHTTRIAREIAASLEPDVDKQRKLADRLRNKLNQLLPYDGSVERIDGYIVQRGRYEQEYRRKSKVWRLKNETAPKHEPLLGKDIQEAGKTHDIPVEALGHDRERVELKAPNTEELKYWFSKAKEGKAGQLGRAAWLMISKMCREQHILDYDKAPAFFEWALDQRGKTAVDAVYCLNIVASKAAELGEEKIVSRIQTDFGDRVVKLFREEFIHDLDARPGSIHLIELIFTPDKRLKLYESCLEALARTDSRKLEGLGRDLRPYFRELYREKEEGVRDWLSRLMERGLEGLSEEENDNVKDWALNYIETIT